MLYPFLAQIDAATKNDAYVWMMGFIAVAVIFSMLMQGAVATKDFFGRKPPLAETLEKFATQTDLKALEQAQNKEVEGLRRDADGRHAENRGRLDRIEKEQTRSTIDIAETRVKTETLLGAVGLQTEKLDRLIERTQPPARRAQRGRGMHT